MALKASSSVVAHLTARLVAAAMKSSVLGSPVAMFRQSTSERIRQCTTLPSLSPCCPPGCVQSRRFLPITYASQPLRSCVSTNHVRTLLLSPKQKAPKTGLPRVTCSPRCQSAATEVATSSLDQASQDLATLAAPVKHQTWKAHIDYKWIRDNESAVAENARLRNSTVDVSKVVALYEQFVEKSKVRS